MQESAKSARNAKAIIQWRNGDRELGDVIHARTAWSFRNAFAQVMELFPRTLSFQFYRPVWIVADPSFESEPSRLGGDEPAEADALDEACDAEVDSFWIILCHYSS